MAAKKKTTTKSPKPPAWAAPVLSWIEEGSLTKAFPALQGVLQAVSDEQRRLSDARRTIYAGRAQALQVMARKRLEALRGAPAFSAAADAGEGFLIQGRVQDEKDGQGLAGVKVVAKDLDRKTDDVVGTAITDWEGRYAIGYRAEDFDDPDKRPEIYLEVYDADDKLLGRTPRSFVDKTTKVAVVSATVAGQTLTSAQDLKARLQAGKAADERRFELGARALGQTTAAAVSTARKEAASPAAATTSKKKSSRVRK